VVEEPKLLVEDGWYVKGAGTALVDFDIKGLMKVTRNEVLQADRASLLELYVAVEAGTAGFNIINVVGGVPTVYGPGADFKVVLAADKIGDEPKADFSRGTLAVGAAPYTVAANGLYHVVIDTQLKKVVVAPVVWGVIGGATPGGWSNSTPMTTTFSKTKMVFTIPEVTMLVGDYKFRYSDGWKIVLDATLDLGGGKKGVNVNTNFGGTFAALVPGGDNMVNSKYGIYNATITWESGKATTAGLTWVKDGPVLATYPEALYMIGNALNMADGSDADTDPDGWSWLLTDAPMVPVHSHPELFWKIVWLEKGGEFKFAPAKEWKGDFGKTGTATDGVFTKGGDNVPVPGETGYYMVTVDLKNNKVEVLAPKIFLVGPTVHASDYTGSVEANKLAFDYTKKDLTVTRTLLAGNLRIHVANPTLACDWWQAEFNIIGGKIEFRGKGGDQTNIPAMTAGSHTINLNFATLVGSTN